MLCFIIFYKAYLLFIYTCFKNYQALKIIHLLFIVFFLHFTNNVAPLSTLMDLLISNTYSIHISTEVKECNDYIITL